jgi:DNA repair protein RAD5
MMVAGDWPESPSQAILFADEIAAVRAVLGAGLPEARIVATLSRCGGNTQRAINALLDDSAHVEDDGPNKALVKVGRDAGGRAPVKVKADAPDEDFRSQESVASSGKPAQAGGGVSLVPRPNKRPREDEATSMDLTATHPVPYLNPRPIRALPPKEAAKVKMHLKPPPRATAPAPARDLRMVAAPPEAECGDFPVEADWFLVRKSYVKGLSTNRGRRTMDAGELVDFSFPSFGRSYGGLKVSAKKAAALAEIVRFSTKRAGEVGTQINLVTCRISLNDFFCAKLW